MTPRPTICRCLKSWMATLMWSSAYAWACSVTTPAAAGAYPAGAQGVADDGVARLDRVHPTAHLFHPPGVFMAQDIRIYGSNVPWGSIAPRHTPSMICKSVRHRPAAPTRTMTSSAAVMVGSGTISSVRSTCRCSSYAYSRAAFVGHLPPARVGEPGVGFAVHHQQRTPGQLPCQ